MITDSASVYTARKDYYFEQLVRIKGMLHSYNVIELEILKDKLTWCSRREGPNALENCRQVREDYIQVLKSYKGGNYFLLVSIGMIQGFPKPVAPNN